MLVKIDYLASVLFTECAAHDFVVLSVNKNKASVDRAIAGHHAVRLQNGVRVVELGIPGRYTLAHFHEAARIQKFNDF